MQKSGQKAFTLIELMIVVAIVGILSAVAYPSYQSYVRTTKESEAKTALVSFASAMSQYYLDGMSYKGAAGSAASPKDTGAPWIFSSQVPIDSGTKTYSLTIKSSTKSTFTLKASPVDSSLKTYCINQLGNKSDKTDCSWTNNW